jgi:ABC-type glycerol-3-phosphate transport system substrate-binding protein
MSLQGIEAAMFEFDPGSPIPIYHQLKLAIKKKIETGEFKPGERIPTEQELCDLCGISRTPVRQALKELVYEGLLIRRRGLGTFVADRTPTDTSSAIPMRLMASDPRRAAVIERAVHQWNERDPHQQVDLQIILTDHSELHRALSSAVAEGTAPDVAMIDCVWIAEFANAGFLIPLDELDADWTHNEYANKPYPAFIEANYFDEHFYGLQVEGDLALLWYRKDWFAAEGLQPPTDWSELLAAAQHFARPDVRRRCGLGPYSLIFPGGQAAGEATVYNLLPFLWSAGGSVLSDGQVSLDSDASRSAVRFVGELVNQRAVVPPEVVNWKPEDFPRRLAGGEAAMALGGSYETVTILEESNWDEAEFLERVDCSLPPAAPEREPAATAGGISYAVLRQSRHPQLMMDILKLAADENLSAGFGLTTFLDSSRTPGRGVFTSHVFPLSSKTSRLLSAARARPSTPEYFKVSKQLQAMFESVITNTASAEQAVRRAAEFIGAITGLPLR